MTESVLYYALYQDWYNPSWLINTQSKIIMKFIKIIAIAAAACGVMVSASCCSKPAPAPVEVPPTK